MVGVILVQPRFHSVGLAVVILGLSYRPCMFKEHACAQREVCRSFTPRTQASSVYTTHCRSVDFHIFSTKRKWGKIRKRYGEFRSRRIKMRRCSALLLRAGAGRDDLAAAAALRLPLLVSCPHHPSRLTRRQACSRAARCHLEVRWTILGGLAVAVRG